MKTQAIVSSKESVQIKKAEELVITSPTDMKEATELLSYLNKTNDRIVEEKEKVTKPLNEALKAERARWKPAETMLAEAISIVRSKMSSYQTAMLTKQREEEAKISARIGEGKGKLKFETAIKKIDTVEKPDDKVITDSGSASFREVKKFEVIDISALPIEFHLADEAKIRKHMQAGIEVAGVRYYTEQSIINKR